MSANNKKYLSKFNSQTYGRVTLSSVAKKIQSFIAEEKHYSYVIIVGTDSQPIDKNHADFVSAVIVHRVGWGGIYFWNRERTNGITKLRPRIYEEASRSLTLAEALIANFRKTGLFEYNLEIHVDVGRRGATKDIVSEVVGMVRGSGYNCKTKPEAYGAASVADRHC